MITIRGLSFRYEGSAEDALKNIDLMIPAGDFIGITGPSGAGKTTLLHAVNGLVPHRTPGDFYGSVTVNGLDTVDSALEDTARTVGTVLQDIDSSAVASTVEDELLFGLENFGVPAQEIEARIEEALFDVGLSDCRSRSLDTLSGGQKQRAAIAAVLALRPRVLVLDEPTGELDPAASERIFTVLKKLNEVHGTTVLVAEQKIMLLSAFCKRLLVLSGGQPALCGPVREVLREEARLSEIGVHCPRVVTLSNAVSDLTGGALAVDVPEAERLVREVLT